MATKILQSCKQSEMIILYILIYIKYCRGGHKSALYESKFVAGLLIIQTQYNVMKCCTLNYLLIVHGS
jgi:hypothetical protein